MKMHRLRKDRSWRLRVTLTAIGLLLVACGDNGEGTTDSVTDAATNTEATDSQPADGEAGTETSTADEVAHLGGQDLIDAAADEGQLVIYTAQLPNAAERLAEVFGERFGVTVDVERRSGSELHELVQTEIEAGQFQGDIIEQTGPEALVELQENYELFAPADSPNTDRYAAADVLSGSIYTPIAFIQTFAVNTDLVPEMPDSWADFASAEYNGRRAVVPPAAGGSAWLASLFQYQELGDGSPEYWEELAAGESVIVGSNTTMGDMLARGEVAITSMIDSIITPMADDGLPVAAVFPEEGVVKTPIGIARVEDSANSAAAELYMNWWLSDGQDVFVDEFSGYSSMEGIATPDHWPDDVTVWEADFDDYVNLQSELIPVWNDLFDYVP